MERVGISLLVGDCGGLSSIEQRILSGGRIGACLGKGGAVVVGGPLIIGATVGGGAGTLRGYLVDKLRLF